MIRRKKMRTKNFLIFLVLVIVTSLLFIILGPATEQNDSIKSIVSQTHQQIKVLTKNLQDANEKSLEVEPRYLELLGFKPTPISVPRSNFSIVTYVRPGQLDTLLLYAQNVQSKLPNDTLLIYDLGLSEDDQRTLAGFCNSSKFRISVLSFDLSPFPGYVTDEKMHAFRPLIVKDALSHANVILFTENDLRIRSNITAKDIYRYKDKTERSTSGVLGWTTATRRAVSSRTHSKMFEYFDTNADNFLFLPMVSISSIFFARTPTVIDKILLPWCQCALIQECIGPIGAQSGGCKYNKKPLYRYSGCHGYDESAVSVLLGLVFGDDKNYAIAGDAPLFYIETPEQATKIMENRRKNSSEASERPYIETT